jgi:hypothetical protein
MPVSVDIRGRIFPARIIGDPDGGRWPIEPLVTGCGYRSASARQIKERLCPECENAPASNGGRCFECRGRSMDG